MGHFGLYLLQKIWTFQSTIDRLLTSTSSYESIENQRNNGSTQINFGYDEISEAHITIMKSPNRDSGSADIDSGRGIVSAHKMKNYFCDDCIHDILETVEDVFLDEAVIFDAEKKKFYHHNRGGFTNWRL